MRNPILSHFLLSPYILKKNKETERKTQMKTNKQSAKINSHLMNQGEDRYRPVISIYTQEKNNHKEW